MIGKNIYNVLQCFSKNSNCSCYSGSVCREYTFIVSVCIAAKKAVAAFVCDAYIFFFVDA